MPSRNNIFISYSHKDSEWLEKLNTHLKPLVRSANFDIWDDTKIKVGQEWKTEITKALSTSKVAILLVSPNFLASDFIYENELPTILNAVEHRDLKIFWVLVSHCLFEETDLVKFQAANNPKKPLESLPDFKQNEVLKDICKKIKYAYLPENEMANNQFGIMDSGTVIPEVAPDDWSRTEGGLFSRIKNLFR